MKMDQTYAQKIEKLAKSLLNLIWQQPDSKIVDLSVRNFAERKLQNHLGQLLDLDDDYQKMARFVTQELNHDQTFKQEILNLCSQSIAQLQKHCAIYGGQQGLLAYALLLTIRPANQNQNLLKAKMSLLDWYLMAREQHIKIMEGNSIGGAISYSWFLELFQQLVLSIAVSSLLYLAKNKLMPILKQGFDKLFQNYGSYQKELAQQIRQPLEQFQKETIKTDLFQQMLALMEADQNTKDQLLVDLIDAFEYIKTTSDFQEINLINSMMKKPIPLTEKLVPERLFSLRKKQIVKFIEIEPSQLYAVLYPDITVNVMSN